jgi:glycosyltransferase involved in cell wall biosynthesis
MGRRVLFFSHFFPPLIGGSSIQMGNVLAPFPKGSIHIIRGQPYKAMLDSNYQVDHPQTVVKFPDWYKRDGNRLLPLLYPTMMKRAFNLHRRDKFQAIYACWPTHWHLEFAFRFHRLAGIPLYVHMHDMWADNIKSSVERYAATLFEKRVLKSAEMVFAITDDAAGHFRQKYGVKTYTLEHSIDWSMVEKPGRFVEIAENEHDLKSIVHLGGIYPLMNQDSVIRINNAVQGIKDAHMWVHLQERDTLEQLGLFGERLTKKPLRRHEVITHLQKASIVTVPLSFDTWAKIEIDTVFPTRCLDFFICGRPILVHAPPDSFLAKDARRKGWGYVVDKPDVDELRRGMQTILEDKALQRNLVKAAWEEAKRRDSLIISNKLQEILGVI